MTKVAVEKGLRPFEEALKQAGFVVVELSGHPVESLTGDTHAVVISGMDEDFLGMQGPTRLPVINAAGRTPQEVVEEVRRSLGPRE